MPENLQVDPTDLLQSAAQHEDHAARVRALSMPVNDPDGLASALGPVAQHRLEELRASNARRAVEAHAIADDYTAQAAGLLAAASDYVNTDTDGAERTQSVGFNVPLVGGSGNGSLDNRSGGGSSAQGSAPVTNINPGWLGGASQWERVTHPTGQWP